MADQPQEQEHRRFSRIDFVDTVQVISDDVEGAQASSWEAQCIDISMRGMLLEVPELFPLEIGTPYEVHLILSEDVIIEMPCTLVHIEEHRAGFRAEMMSIDSLTNLRRLLELNLADNAEVERELGALIQQTA
jgi:PilZ domain